MIIYVDVILVNSKGGKEKHEELINDVFKRLEVRVNLSKVHLCKKEVDLLGLHFSVNGWSLAKKYLSSFEQ